MIFSEKRDQIAAALVAAQAQLAPLFKNTEGHGYKYATLPSVLNSIKDALAANGVAIIQGVEEDECITTLQHRGGQWVATKCPMKYASNGRQNPMQSMGSAYTYARRYSLLAALGCSPDDERNAHLYADDDGVSSAGHPSPTSTNQASAKPPEPAEIARNGHSPIGYTECVERIKAMGQGYLRSVQRYRSAVGLPGLADVTDATRGAFLSQLVQGGRLMKTIDDLSSTDMRDSEILHSIQTSVSHAYDHAGGALRKNYPSHVIGLLKIVGDMSKSIHAAEMCILYDLLVREAVPDVASQMH